jgi:hypothetical protein
MFAAPTGSDETKRGGRDRDWVGGAGSCTLGLDGGVVWHDQVSRLGPLGGHQATQRANPRPAPAPPSTPAGCQQQAWTAGEEGRLAPQAACPAPHRLCAVGCAHVRRLVRCQQRTGRTCSADSLASRCARTLLQGLVAGVPGEGSPRGCSRERASELVWDVQSCAAAAGSLPGSRPACRPCHNLAPVLSLLPALLRACAAFLTADHFDLSQPALAAQ